MCSCGPLVFAELPGLSACSYKQGVLQILIIVSRFEDDDDLFQQYYQKLPTVRQGEAIAIAAVKEVTSAASSIQTTMTTESVLAWSIWLLRQTSPSSKITENRNKQGDDTIGRVPDTPEQQNSICMYDKLQNLRKTKHYNSKTASSQQTLLNQA